MFIVQVMIHVKPEHLEAFQAATLDNARNSVREPGIARFDVIQQADDPTRFMLVEVYRDAEALARHRETAHFAAWREAVTELLVEPRTRLQYANIFPNDGGWDMPPGYVV
jgi:(4S)-4-hydroxy-5-phosphonooxypentane-2,3-dione isomerase